MVQQHQTHCNQLQGRLIQCYILHLHSPVDIMLSLSFASALRLLFSINLPKLYYSIIIYKAHDANSCDSSPPQNKRRSETEKTTFLTTDTATSAQFLCTQPYVLQKKKQV